MIRLESWACPVFALLLLLLPLPWLLAAVTAAVFHELCHAGAVYALGGRIRRVTIGPAGAVMETEIFGQGRELLAALAGPAGSLALVLLGRFLPRLAVCAGIQGLFNLLPLYPLDGGRALRCALEGRVSGRTLRFLEGVLAGLAAVIVLRWSIFFAGILLIRLFFGKIPCKLRTIGVQ